MYTQPIAKFVSLMLLVATVFSPLGVQAVSLKTSTQSVSQSLSKLQKSFKAIKQKGSTLSQYSSKATTSYINDMSRNAGAFTDETILRDWEIAKSQLMAANQLYIDYVKSLKKQLDSQISKGNLTEISNTNFLDTEIFVMEAFNEAYGKVTRIWIQEVAATTGQSIPDEDAFATNVLASIASVQVIYNGYVSVVNTTGASGLLVTTANKQVLASSYTYAKETLPQLIQKYASNLLKLQEPDLSSFVAYYNGRIEADIVTHLDTIAQKNAEATTIFVNDVLLVERLGHEITTLVNDLAYLFENMWTDMDALREVTDDLKAIAGKIQDLAAVVENKIYTAQSQLQEIVLSYAVISKNIQTLTNDLLFEYNIRNDASHCRKWKGPDAASCQYN